MVVGRYDVGGDASGRAPSASADRVRAIRATEEGSQSPEERSLAAHIFGCNAFTAPVLHLRRLSKGGLFDMYAQSFEAVWSVSKAAVFSNNGNVA